MPTHENFLQRRFAVFAFASVFASIAAVTFTVDRAVSGGTLLWQPFAAIVALYAALFAMHHMIEMAACRGAEPARAGLTDAEMTKIPQTLAA